MVITISLCMIVKNEEDTLFRCLDSVRDIVDEIIIVDTGSIDSTKEIAKKFTTKIYDFEWVNDFSAARNYSFSKATMEYILWLDADDVILPKDREKFLTLKESLSKDTDVVMMKYDIQESKSQNSLLFFYRERLLKRSRNFKWYDNVHEYLVYGGNIMNSDICITHRKEKLDLSRNLNIFEDMISKGKTLSHRNYYYYAKELFVNERYDEAIEYYNKFLSIKGGIVTSYISSCLDLAKCHSIKNENDKVLSSLLRSFEYDIPHAEACCQIGFYYKGIQDYKKATFWFELASLIKIPEDTWGIVMYDYWDFIPYMELCDCYFILGKYKDALRYINLALKCKPNDQKVMERKITIESIINNSISNL